MVGWTGFGDKMLAIIGLWSSIVVGAATPAFCIVFGDMIDGVGQTQGLDALREQGIIMVIVGVIVWLMCLGMVGASEIFSERLGF